MNQSGGTKGWWIQSWSGTESDNGLAPNSYAGRRFLNLEVQYDVIMSLIQSMKPHPWNLTCKIKCSFHFLQGLVKTMCHSIKHNSFQSQLGVKTSYPPRKAFSCLCVLLKNAFQFDKTASTVASMLILWEAATLAVASSSSSTSPSVISKGGSCFLLLSQQKRIN